MSVNTLVIEGISILNHLSELKEKSKPNHADPVVKSFLEHVKNEVSELQPLNAVVVLPSDSSIESKKMQSIVKVLKGLGIDSVPMSSEQAGHTIKSIIEQSKGESVITSDSLMFTQLISDRCSYKKYGSSETVDSSSLKKMIGISESSVPDLSSLIGDKNFGIKNYIGANTAVGWLMSYQSIDGIKNNIDKLPRAMSKQFSENFNEISEQMSKTKFSSGSMFVADYDVSRMARNSINLQSLYKDYIDEKLFSWLPDDLREKYLPKTNYESETTYTEFVNSHSMANEIVSKAKQTGSASVYVSGEMASVSLKNAQSFVFSMKDSYSINAIKEILSNESVKIIAHDAKALYHWANNNESSLTNLISDSAILAFVLDTANSEATLPGLSESVLGIKIESKKSENSEDDKIRLLGEYSDIQLRVNKELYTKASKDKAARRIFETIDRPLIKTLFEIEREGFLLDTDGLAKLGEEMLNKSKLIENTVRERTGKTYDLGKGAEVAKMLYDDLGLPVLKKTTKGAPSTSEAALSGLMDKSDIPAMVLEHRSIMKLHSSYIKGLANKVDKETNRIFTTFFQNVAVTTRLSSRDPNLQNIPIKSDDGKRIRQAFIAESDNYILAADYSQIELRILAHLSGDEKLIEAFNSGMDIHRATASEIFGVKPEDVTGEQRRAVKSINFGIVYGMSAYGLAEKLGTTTNEAEKFINKYFDKYPKVRIFIENTKKSARANKYVQTVTGRKIPCHHIDSSNQSNRKSAERAAVNAPMQGSASDIIKMAMNNMMDRMTKEKINARMLSQVHDELVFEVHKSDVKKLNDMVIEVMEGAIKLDVPLLVEADIGKNWENSHSLDSHNEITLNEFTN